MAFNKTKITFINNQECKRFYDWLNGDMVKIVFNIDIKQEKQSFYISGTFLKVSTFIVYTSTNFKGVAIG